jgi:hypothetical protein
MAAFTASELGCESMPLAVVWSQGTMDTVLACHLSRLGKKLNVPVGIKTSRIDHLEMDVIPLCFSVDCAVTSTACVSALTTKS